mmetsp:Transcript_34490/g.25582  ORF Transcript_34490/g.25582 Transcript_34490/m.25582 type:complete len:146 (+) Transcript_34490:940-1377(+)
MNLPLHKDANLLALKLSLDNAVLAQKASQSNITAPRIEMKQQAFPYVPDRLFQNADPTSSTGTFYLALIPLSVFMIFYEEMVREKCTNLRMGLLAIGCNNFAFFLSWIVTGIFLSAMMSILMYAFGLFYGFSIFIKTPFYVLFIH